MSYATQMVEARRSKAGATPAVYGRDRRFGQARNRTGATESVDQGDRESIHAGVHAIFANIVQREICDIGICQCRKCALHIGRMELEEIKARMAERGDRQADLANMLGINPTAISKAFSGKRQFTHAEMLKIDAWFGAQAVETASGIHTIPVIGQVAAGTWREAIQRPVGHMPVAATHVPKRAFGLEVQGDSMDLKVPDGGTVVVDPDDKALFPGRLFVVLNGDGETTFKQFASDPARLMPCSSNPAHQAIQLGDGTPYTVVGRVIGAYSPL